MMSYHGVEACCSVDDGLLEDAGGGTAKASSIRGVLRDTDQRVNSGQQVRRTRQQRNNWNHMGNCVSLSVIASAVWPAT